ncbi:hypothetical protein MKX03_014058 [Papaver bracteatum]|nr:hypothetical protein MKX03_014058 [Papaver bracteatum]
MSKISQDLSPRNDDKFFARDILMFPGKDWENEGDYLEKPFGEGSSSPSPSSSNLVSNRPIRLYFRCLVTEENVKGSVTAFPSIGAAICDPLILEVQKPLNGQWKSLSHRYAYVKALLEGLNAAHSVYSDYHLFQQEASVPVMEKVYCPNPKCSTLMRKSEVLSSNDLFGSANQSRAYKCIKCHGIFCINCKVPWHRGVSCFEYKRLNPRGEEAELKCLASQQLWRQCVKCNHMIELAEGCYHMTCRCGFEFCYACGAEWKNKKATCDCLVRVEHNIFSDDSDEGMQILENTTIM